MLPLYSYVNKFPHTRHLDLNLFILHRLRKKRLAYINHDRCLTSWRHNQYSRRLCGKIPKEEPAHYAIRTRHLWYDTRTASSMKTFKKYKATLY